MFHCWNLFKLYMNCKLYFTLDLRLSLNTGKFQWLFKVCFPLQWLWRFLTYETDSYSALGAAVPKEIVCWAVLRIRRGPGPSWKWILWMVAQPKMLCLHKHKANLQGPQSWSLTHFSIKYSVCKTRAEQQREASQISGDYLKSNLCLALQEVF